MNAQAAAALKRGTEIRLAGLATRREIAALDYVDGLRRTAEVLEDPELAIQRMRVDRLLTAVRGLSTYRVSKVLGSVDVHPLRDVGPDVNAVNGHRAMTENQRRNLAAELRRMADGRRDG